MEEPKTLQEAVLYFSDIGRCIVYLAQSRWPDGAVCPTCGRKDVSYVEKRRVWQCKSRHPKCQFSIKVGTIFEDSPISLAKWLPCMWMLANCKNGISSWEIHRALGVTQKTAWFMLHRIRLALKKGSLEKMGNDGSPVEVDEAFVGGTPRFMHANRRKKLNVGRSSYGDYKAAVMGMLDRDTRQVRAKVIPNVKRETLQNEILNHIHQGATVYTDQATGYGDLNTQQFVHETVNHMEEYVRGQVHTNGIENFWSLLKRGLKGTYVAVEPFHLDRYLDEQAFRYNNRATTDNPLNDADRFALAVMQIVGRRVTYAELTGKLDARPF